MPSKKVLEKKSVVIDQLARELASSQLAVLTDYRGLTVAEISELRRRLREIGVEYHVSKNTLTRAAAKKAGVGAVEPLLVGPTAIAFASDDVTKAAKVLRDYAKGSKVFSIKGGVLSGKVIGAGDVVELAELPPREVLVAKVLGLMQSPVAGLVNVLSGPTRNLAYVLRARAEQLQAAG